MSAFFSLTSVTTRYMKLSAQLHTPALYDPLGKSPPVPFSDIEIICQLPVEQYRTISTAWIAQSVQ